MERSSPSVLHVPANFFTTSRRRNRTASGPASIEMRLKADTAVHLLPVMQAIQELRH